MPVLCKKEVNTPRVSVILAAYRSGQTIFESIGSVLKQDWPDIEMILCDDGTEDFVPSAIEHFLQQNNRGNCVWKLIHQPQNIGTVRNLNTGLQVCTGDWIILLAADDAFAGPDVLSGLMQLAAQTQKSWLISYTALCDSHLCPTGKICPTEKEIAILKQADQQLLWSTLCRRCFLPSSGTIYRRSFLQTIGAFDERCRLVEDWPLFLKAVRLGYLPDICEITSVLHRAGGVSHSWEGKNAVYQTDLIAVIKNEILPFLKELPASDRQRIQTFCADKQAVYTLRFESKGISAKIRWLSSHPGTMIRKFLAKIREETT